MKSFGKAGPRDEGLHPHERGAPADLTETSYLGFQAPDAGISGAVYVWFHPVLGSVSAGVLVWRGIKAHALEAEHFDYRAHLPLPATDVDDYTLANGLHVKVVEPLRRVQVEYADESSGTRLSFESSAIMPPAVPREGKHLVQAVRNQGELVLHGESIPIAGFFTRDRSWGRPRPEAPMPVPAVGWLAGVFGDDFAFHVRAVDSDQARGDVPVFGYVRRDGETFGVARVSKRTRLAPDGLAPLGVDLTIEDSGGASHDIRGEAVTRLPWSPWPNVLSYWCQARFECGGRSGTGEHQHYCWPHSVRAAGASTG